jgi:hypothetical protein
MGFSTAFGWLLDSGTGWPVPRDHEGMGVPTARRGGRASGTRGAQPLTTWLPKAPSAAAASSAQITA